VQIRRVRKRERGAGQLFTSLRRFSAVRSQYLMGIKGLKSNCVARSVISLMLSGGSEPRGVDAVVDV
jgi:hypothetical protein